MLTESQLASMITKPENQDKDEKILAERVEYFRRTWTPKGEREARRFEAELIYLIAVAQRVAQQPLVNIIAAKP